MIRISVASHKRGTGKTAVAMSAGTSLARKRSVYFLGCDVEASNAALFLQPAIARHLAAEVLA